MADFSGCGARIIVWKLMPVRKLNPFVETLRGHNDPTADLPIGTLQISR